MKNSMKMKKEMGKKSVVGIMMCMLMMVSLGGCAGTTESSAFKGKTLDYSAGLIEKPYEVFHKGMKLDYTFANETEGVNQPLDDFKGKRLVTP